MGGRQAVLLSLPWLGALLGGCAMTVPEGMSVAKNFEPKRYEGRWYEIARLDHSFERGLSRVTADYTPREDGGINVKNRGYKDATGKWSEANGRAYLTGAPSIGQLKVSFFRPFYGAYNIVALDPEYRHAMVVGPDTSYLWILAREPVLPPETLQVLVKDAAAKGFDTGQLIYVEHGAAAPSQ